MKINFNPSKRVFENAKYIYNANTSGEKTYDQLSHELNVHYSYIAALKRWYKDNVIEKETNHE